MLAFIANELDSINVRYDFMRWTGAVQYPYFVGEYTETATINEDGYKEYSFILNGFTRGSWLELEQMKAKIESHFPAVGGLRGRTTDGSAVAVFYENSFTVQTGEAELKRIQINLNVKEWSDLT